MYSQLGYGTPPGLDPGGYYRLLYEANVRPELLDHIGREYSFLPAPSVRALHEGHAIRWVNTNVDWNHSVSTETEREVGDTYVLIFAAVALRRFGALAYQHPDLRDAARDLLICLRADGFTFETGHVLDSRGNIVVPIPLGGSSSSSVTTDYTATNQGGEGQTLGSAAVETKRVESVAPSTPRIFWSRGEKIGVASLVLTLLGICAAWLVVPEFRGIFHLDKAQSGAPSQSPITPASAQNPQPPDTGAIFSVSDGHGSPVAGAEILVIQDDGTHLKPSITHERGSARLEAVLKKPVTIFCSHPHFQHYSSERVRVEDVFNIACGLAQTADP